MHMADEGDAPYGRSNLNLDRRRAFGIYIELSDVRKEKRWYMKLPEFDLFLLLIVGCGVFLLLWIISSLQ